VSSADPSSSQGIRGYVSVTATFKFTFLIKGIIFVVNNREAYLIVDMFISCDHYDIEL
jgi:hypothetical protein